jgi:hypothetical protein
LVFAVTEVGLVERLSSDSPPERTIELRSADGELNQSSFGPEMHFTNDEVTRVRTKLDAIEGRWTAWPRRLDHSV